MPSRRPTRRTLLAALSWLLLCLALTGGARVAASAHEPMDLVKLNAAAAAVRADVRELAALRAAAGGNTAAATSAPADAAAPGVLGDLADSNEFGRDIQVGDLPAWRWGFGSYTSVWAKSGRFNFLPALLAFINGLCLKLGGAVWMLILFLLKFALSSFGLFQNGGTASLPLARVINDSAARLLRPVGVLGGTMVMLTMVSSIKPFFRRGGSLAAFFKPLGTVVAGLVLALLVGGAASTAAASDDPSVALSPTWLGSKTANVTQEFFDAAAVASSGDSLGGGGRELGLEPSCTTLMEFYYRGYMATGASMDSKGSMVALSRLWESGVYNQWVTAQFGAGSATYSPGHRAACHLLDLKSKNDPGQLLSDASKAYNGAKGHLSSGGESNLPSRDRVNDPMSSSMFSVAVNDADKDNDNVARRIAVAWAACAYVNGNWYTAPGFRYLQDAPTAEDCAAAFRSGDFKDSFERMDRDDYKVDPGSSAARPIPGIDDTHDLNYSKQAEMRMVGDFFSSFLGAPSGYGMLGGGVALGSGIVYGWVLLPLAFGALLLKLSVIVLIPLLPLTILLRGWEMARVNGGGRQIGAKLFRMTTVAVMSSNFFAVFVTGLVYAIYLITDLLFNIMPGGNMALPADTGGSLAAGADLAADIAPGGGGGMAMSFWLMLAPVLALVLVRFILKSVGMGDITKVGDSMRFLSKATQSAAKGAGAGAGGVFKLQAKAASRASAVKVPLPSLSRNADTGRLQARLTRKSADEAAGLSAGKMLALATGAPALAFADRAVQRGRKALTDFDLSRGLSPAEAGKFGKRIKGAAAAARHSAALEGKGGLLQALGAASAGLKAGLSVRGIAAGSLGAASLASTGALVAAAPLGMISPQVRGQLQARTGWTTERLAEQTQALAYRISGLSGDTSGTIAEATLESMGRTRRTVVKVFGDTDNIAEVMARIPGATAATAVGLLTGGAGLMLATGMCGVAAVGAPFVSAAIVPDEDFDFTKPLSKQLLRGPMKGHVTGASLAVTALTPPPQAMEESVRAAVVAAPLASDEVLALSPMSADGMPRQMSPEEYAQAQQAVAAKRGIPAKYVYCSPEGVTQRPVVVPSRTGAPSLSAEVVEDLVALPYEEALDLLRSIQSPEFHASLGKRHTSGDLLADATMRRSLLLDAGVMRLQDDEEGNLVGLSYPPQYSLLSVMTGGALRGDSDTDLAAALKAMRGDAEALAALPRSIREQLAAAVEGSVPVGIDLSAALTDPGLAARYAQERDLYAAHRKELAAAFVGATAQADRKLEYAAATLEENEAARPEEQARLVVESQDLLDRLGDIQQQLADSKASAATDADQMRALVQEMIAAATAAAEQVERAGAGERGRQVINWLTSTSDSSVEEHYAALQAAGDRCDKQAQTLAGLTHLLQSLLRDAAEDPTVITQNRTLTAVLAQVEALTQEANATAKTNTDAVSQVLDGLMTEIVTASSAVADTRQLQPIAEVLAPMFR